jgi:hypothetical protein
MMWLLIFEKLIPIFFDFQFQKIRVHRSTLKQTNTHFSSSSFLLHSPWLVQLFTLYIFFTPYTPYTSPCKIDVWLNCTWAEEGEEMMKKDRSLILCVSNTVFDDDEVRRWEEREEKHECGFEYNENLWLICLWVGTCEKMNDERE